MTGNSATRLKLRPHPASPGVAPIEISATVARPSPGVLTLDYTVTGTLNDLLIPAPAEPSRTDGLWRHTCFEAFVRFGAGEGYAEFNFSPSGDWAAYGFSGYREGMTPLDIGAPAIEVRYDGGGLELKVRLELTSALSAGARLGLSAVIEDRGGGLSYWALAHPATQPDFHHRGGFVYER